ncbi:MAG: MFS transporter [Planctomycetes bacterium]|nr:MFS transporter [Planctomycetota bacterium]
MPSDPNASANAPDYTNFAPRTGWASLRDLNKYQWFVFFVAAIAWMADCMDQQLFNLARVMSLTDLLGGASANPDDVKTWAAVATAVFLVGWGAGGLVFGMYGDRIGRVKTLTYTILLYSIFTGFSALSQGPYDYCVYRFLTGLGVGGVFAAAVSLLAETMPSHARPFTLGLMQASSAFGNCTAALMFISLGLLELNGHLDGLRSVGLNAWRVLFLIGLFPALLVIFIQRRLKEPESWVRAKAAADDGTGRKLGSYGDLFTNAMTRKHAVLGMLLAFVGVVGLWGIAFFSVDLQQSIFRPTFAKEAAVLHPFGDDVAKLVKALRSNDEGADPARPVTAAEIDAALKAAKAKPEAERSPAQVELLKLAAPVEKERGQYLKGQGIIWAGITSLAINIGAFCGMSGFSWLASKIGRKPAFMITIVAAAGSVALVFMGMKTRTDIIWMNFVMGVCMLALFGGYAVYLPELFPTRLRATGTSFCYNVGRFIAASGPLMLGVLTTQVFAYASEGGQYQDRPFRYAGLAMCSIFAMGLLVLPFLPETKDKPLPE